MSTCGKITKATLTGLIMICLVAIQLSSCSSPITVEGFDSQSWKTDTSGCKNNRMALFEHLIQHKKELMDKKDEKLMDYLGKPDQTLFFARGKKTLIYQIDPGSPCTSMVEPNQHRTLRFDINALGRVELVYLLRQ